LRKGYRPEKQFIVLLLSVLMATSSGVSCVADEAESTQSTMQQTESETTTQTVTTTENKERVVVKHKQKKKSKKKHKKSKQHNIKKNVKKKEAKIILMPKRTIRKKGCVSIQKRINQKKLNIKHAREKQKKYKTLIQKDQTRRIALSKFYETYDQKVSYVGQEMTPLTKLTEQDLKMKNDLMKLAELYQDQELSEIAATYVFGVHEMNFLQKEETINLNDYLKTKYIQPDNTLQGNIKKLDQKIAQWKQDIKKEKKTRYFDPKDVSSISNITVSDAKEMLSGTQLYQDATSFVKAERIYHVNAVFLMGIAAHESAWGTSRRAKEDNNLTGYGVYSNDAKGINKASREEGLLATANTLHERYLSKGGSYYEGTSAADINKHYCTDNEWASAVVTYSYQLMNKLN
jgi:beta-N-acetylglucosaminidase